MPPRAPSDAGRGGRGGHGGERGGGRGGTDRGNGRGRGGTDRGDGRGRGNRGRGRGRGDRGGPRGGADRGGPRGGGGRGRGRGAIIDAGGAVVEAGGAIVETSGYPLPVNPTLFSGRTGPLPAEHIQAIGVKRRQYGNAGKVIKLRSNHVEVQLNQGTVYHYDGMYLLFLRRQMTYESIFWCYPDLVRQYT